MGGKSKQSQRTKNNVRPSSSSRSAELLSGGISLDGGLMSLAGVKPLPPLFPTLAAANLEQGLNPEFQMCIKKLNKKDPITRAKALHELCDLVNNGDVEDVVTALPSWAHFYKILTMDTDRKVREMTQVCHGAMVRVCGRRTAPQLKTLLPAWLQAQYDDHAPAQAQANLSLNSTFPDSKLPEVISFCKAEVMAHLLENLIGNTEAIVNKRIENAEERQLVLNRITTSSLQGLQYFCAHLPAAHHAWLWGRLRPLLQAGAYWRLAQASPQVRAAWCGATGRLLERYGDTFGAAHGARCLRVQLQAARDPAPAATWTCLLQLMHNVQDWHTYLDKKELLVKRILDVLENGGWGDAKHLSNMLLPLLAYLPQDILTKHFYESFFNAVFVGLEKKIVLNSKSERQAWITSLAECLRYLSIQQNDFVLEIVSGVQRTWLACVLAAQHDGQTRTNLIKCSATNMASLVKYWLKQSKEENGEKYDQLIRNFWQNVGATVLAQIDKSGTDYNEIGKLMEGHILLLQTLKTTFSQEVKKQHSIKFDGDAPAVSVPSAAVTPACDAAVSEPSAAVTPACDAAVSEPSAAVTPACDAAVSEPSAAVTPSCDAAVSEPSAAVTPACDAAVSEPSAAVTPSCDATVSEPSAAVTGACDVATALRYKHNLDDVVHKICAQYLESAEKKQISSAIVTPVVTLLVEFDSEQLFLALGRQFGVDSVYRLYDKVFRTWLSGDTMRCKDVVDIVLLLMKYLTEEEQDAMFDSFQQFPPAALEWCLSACARHPYVRARGARRWLRSHVARAALRRAARRAPACRAALAVLLACVRDEPAGELLVSSESVCDVLVAVCDSISQPDSSTLDAGGALAAWLVTSLQDHVAEPYAGPVTSLQDHVAKPYAGPVTSLQDHVAEPYAGPVTSLQDHVAEPYAGPVTSLQDHVAEPYAGPVTSLQDHVAEPYAGPVTSLQDHVAEPYARLVLQLFRLNVLVPRGDSRLSASTWGEVRSAWQDGAAALPAGLRARSLQRAQHFLHDQLFQSMEKLDIAKIENIVSVCPHLFNLGEEAQAPADVAAALHFGQQVSRAAGQCARVAACALRHVCATCALNCPHADDALAAVVQHSADTHVQELTKTDLLLYVNKHLFRAIYLRTLLLHNVSSADDEDEPSEQKTWCNVLLNDEYVRTEFCNVLYTYVVINTLHEGYAFWPHYDIIVETKQKLESLLLDVISATDAAVRRDVTAWLSQLALARGYLWALAQRWYTVHADLTDDKGILDGHKLEDIVSGNGYFHTLQASTLWSGEPNSALAYKIQYLVMLRSWYLAFGAPGQLELRDVTRGRDTCDLDVVIDAYYKHNHTMLYDMDISDCAWSSLVSNVAVLEFLTAMVTSRGWDASAHHWDFATISLCSLLASVRKTVAVNWGSTKVCMLARAALRLWAGVARFVAGVGRESERRQPQTHVADLVNEWRDIFQPDTTYNLLYIIMHVLDSCNEGEMTSPQVEVVGELIECTQLVKWDALADAHKLDALSLERLARCAADALHSPAPPACLQLAYQLLLALSKPLVLDDAEKLSLWSEDNSEGDEETPRPQFCLDLFHDTFTHLHEIVDAAVSNVVLGEGTCEVVAMSDTYRVALGWLLLADVLAELCSLARGDLTHHYIQIYRERGYAEPLVTATLRLLPDGVFLFASDNTGSTAAPPAFADLFLKLRPFSIHEPARGSDICALACRALYGTVCGPGTSGARGWWGAAAARAARLLERVVAAYVAPSAARDQLVRLQQRAHEIEDAEVRIAWSSNEVTCVYNVEERLIELRVWLARAHPLAAPRLTAPHAHGPGADTHWVALYLSYQNGTLLNALKMWTRAVSAKVESSPQCYICYCRLHPNNGRLPRVLCHQCKNKFHTICLRKWFSTSNKSNCPLCRAAF